MKIEKQYILKSSVDMFDSGIIHFDIEISQFYISQFYSKIQELYTNIMTYIPMKLDIETDMGILINCTIQSFNVSIGDSDKFTELSIKGLARSFDKYIKIKFKDCKDKKMVLESVYNIVIENIGHDITYKQYKMYEFMENI